MATFETIRGSGIGNSGSSYLVYTALLSQSGTNAPSASLLGTSTLIDTVTFYYDNVGTFSGFYDGANSFDKSKTFILIGAGSDGNSNLTTNAWIDNSGAIQIRTNAGDGSLSNSVLSNTTIEIRVYP